MKNQLAWPPDAMRCPMPGPFKAQLWEYELTPQEQLLLQAMAEHNEHRYSGSIPRLSWYTRLEERTIQRLLHGSTDARKGRASTPGLIARGIVVEISKAIPGEKVPATYRLNLDAAQLKEPYNAKMAAKRQQRALELRKLPGDAATPAPPSPGDAATPALVTLRRSPGDAAPHKPNTYPKTHNQWTEILEALRQTINPNSFETWLKPTRLDHVQGSTLYVKVPTAGHTHIGTKYQAEILASLPPDIDEVHFIVDGLEPPAAPLVAPAQLPATDHRKKPRSKRAAPQSPELLSLLHHTRNGGNA